MRKVLVALGVLFPALVGATQCPYLFCTNYIDTWPGDALEVSLNADITGAGKMVRLTATATAGAIEPTLRANSLLVKQMGTAWVDSLLMVPVSGASPSQVTGQSEYISGAPGRPFTAMDTTNPAIMRAGLANSTTPYVQLVGGVETSNSLGIAQVMVLSGAVNNNGYYAWGNTNTGPSVTLSMPLLLINGGQAQLGRYQHGTASPFIWSNGVSGVASHTIVVSPLRGNIVGLSVSACGVGVAGAIVDLSASKSGSGYTFLAVADVGIVNAGGSTVYLCTVANSCTMLVPSKAAGYEILVIGSATDFVDTSESSMVYAANGSGYRIYAGAAGKYREERLDGTARTIYAVTKGGMLEIRLRWWLGR